MMVPGGDWNGAAVVVGGWLLTYLIHSTMLLGAAALITKVGQASEAVADVVWKVALVGGLVTSLVVVAGDIRPVGGRMMLSVAPAVVAADEAMGAEAGIREEDAVNARVEPHMLSEEAMKRADVVRGRSSGVSELRGESNGASARDVIGSMKSLAMVLAWIWGAGALAMAARLVVRRRNLFALLGRRVPVKGGPVLEALEELRQAALIRRRVRLTTSRACPLPLALTSSEVCVPDRFLVELDADEQRGALAHEVAHLARRDPMWLLAAMGVEALMYIQPLNRLARRRLKESAEYLCDEWAAGEGAGLGLARCLARVAVWLRPGADPLLAATSAIADGRSGLVRRVERLLAGRTTVRRGRARLGLGLALAMLLVVMGAAPAVSVIGPSASAVREEGKLGAAVAIMRGQRLQEVVVRAPRVQDAIGQRWAWALTEARSRGYRGFWVAYAFDRPVGAQEQYLSDSDGVNMDDRFWRGTPLRSVLGAQSERGTIVVLFHFRSGSGDDAIDRIGHRSMNVPMDFGGQPVLWLGTAEDAQSVPWLDGVRARVRQPNLQAEVVEAVALHATSALVLPVLDRLLTSDESDVVRMDAAEGLEHHDTPESMRLAERTARNDASQQVRQEAAEALGGIDVAGATGVLVDLALSGSEGMVRMEAAEALGDHPSSRALPALERLIFQSTETSVGMEAVEAVGSVEGGARLELLRRVIWEHPTTELRREAVETLEEVESADALGVLEEVLRRHPDGVVRKEAVDVLSSLDSPASRRILLETLTSGRSAEDRREAIETLADQVLETRSATEIAELAQLLERAIFGDPDRGVRMEALQAVEELPRDVARALLRKVLETHPDAGVRREAVDILASMR